MVGLRRHDGDDGHDPEEDRAAGARLVVKSKLSDFAPFSGGADVPEDALARAAPSERMPVSSRLSAAVCLRSLGRPAGTVTFGAALAA